MYMELETEIYMGQFTCLQWVLQQIEEEKQSHGKHTQRWEETHYMHMVNPTVGKNDNSNVCLISPVPVETY